MICLGEETNTNLSDLRESFEEQSYIYIFQNKTKPKFLSRVKKGDLNSCCSIIQLPKILC